MSFLNLETRPHLIYFLKSDMGVLFIKLLYLWNGNWRNGTVTLAAEYGAGFGYAGSATQISLSTDLVKTMPNHLEMEIF